MATQRQLVRSRFYSGNSVVATVHLVEGDDDYHVAVRHPVRDDTFELLFSDATNAEDAAADLANAYAKAREAMRGALDNFEKEADKYRS